MQKQKGPETVRLPGLLKSLVVLKRQRVSGLLGWKLSTSRQQQQQQQTPHATRRIDYLLQEAASGVNPL
jgi:hypothetical protein